VLSCGHEAGDGEAVIALNNAYLIQALESIETDDVIMELKDSTMPAVFRPSGGSCNHLHLIMPMSVRG